MFERGAPDFVPSDASRMAGLRTFEMLAARVAAWRPDRSDPAADAHLVWATMHGLVSIELMHRRWGGPLVAHLQGDAEQNYATAISSPSAGRRAAPGRGRPRARRRSAAGAVHRGARWSGGSQRRSAAICPAA